MDISMIGGKALELIKKYRYAILVLIIGIGLMAIPMGADNGQEPATAPHEIKESFDQTEALTHILSQIKGAGKVKGLLTVNTGEKTVYQTDQDTSNSAESGSARYETVIITDGNREQHGLIQQMDAPVYRGAIVVCQGADNAEVRLAIVEAVANATGLGTDRISVLKMK